jgi:hypothetical protein
MKISDTLIGCEKGAILSSRDLADRSELGFSNNSIERGE